MKICVLDADSIIYYVIHHKKEEPEKSLDEIKANLDAWLFDIWNKTGSTHYHMYLTAGKSFRKEYLDTYKENRKDIPKPQYFDEIKAYLIQKYHARFYSGLEADDLCFITYSIVRSLDPDTQVFMCSPDKDILNLEGEHYNYRTGIWKHTTDEEAAYYFWGSMIIGDNGDNVKGIPGKGKVYVQNLLKNTEYLVEELPSVILLEYIKEFGEDKGIELFYQNYKALRILYSHPEVEKLLVEEWEPKEINYGFSGISEEST